MDKDLEVQRMCLLVILLLLLLHRHRRLLLLLMSLPAALVPAVAVG